MMYMAKCRNPDCCVPEHYPRGHNLQAVITEWNRIHRERGLPLTIGGQVVRKILEESGPEPGGEGAEP